MSHISGQGYQLASVSGDAVVWELRRNCSVSPKQLGWVFLMLGVVSLGVAVMFWLQGATLVLPFALLEMTALGTAFVVYARHATDRERIVWREGCLTVECELAGRCESQAFQGHCVRVRPGRQRHRLVELQAQGRAVQVGRFVREELRPTLEREIRTVLGRG